MALWLTPEELEKSEALHRRVHELLERSDNLRSSWKDEGADIHLKAEPKVDCEAAATAVTAATNMTAATKMNTSETGVQKVLQSKSLTHTPSEAEAESSTRKALKQRETSHSVSIPIRGSEDKSIPSIPKQLDRPMKASAQTQTLTGQFSGRIMKISSNPNRKVDLSSLGSLAAKNDSSSDRPPKRSLDGASKVGPSLAPTPMPAWWHRSLKPGEKKKVQTKERSNLELFADFKNAKEQNARTSQGIEQVRLALQKIGCITVSPECLIQSKIMEEQNLPQLLPGSSRSANLPFDIQADAQALYRKWFRGDFDSDILRGIKIARAASLDQSWPYSSSAKFIGEGHLVNGQWWPYQLCALRDGAHGASVAGIFGHEGLAVSIVVAKSKYDDVDNGDVLNYFGTEGKGEGNPSADTRLMMKSCEQQQPVRVLRSSTLGSKYAPSKGYRYDGLYRVVQQELIDSSKSHYLFYLERLPDQHPIRYSGNRSRPTLDEIVEFQNHHATMQGRF